MCQKYPFFIHILYPQDFRNCKWIRQDTFVHVRHLIEGVFNGVFFDHYFWFSPERFTQMDFLISLSVVFCDNFFNLSDVNVLKHLLIFLLINSVCPFKLCLKDISKLTTYLRGKKKPMYVDLFNMFCLI